MVRAFVLLLTLVPINGQSSQSLLDLLIPSQIGESIRNGRSSSGFLSGQQAGTAGNRTSLNLRKETVKVLQDIADAPRQAIANHGEEQSAALESALSSLALAPARLMSDAANLILRPVTVLLNAEESFTTPLQQQTDSLSGQQTPPNRGLLFAPLSLLPPILQIPNIVLPTVADSIPAAPRSIEEEAQNAFRNLRATQQLSVQADAPSALSSQSSLQALNDSPVAADLPAEEWKKEWRQQVWDTWSRSLTTALEEEAAKLIAANKTGAERS